MNNLIRTIFLTVFIVTLVSTSAWARLSGSAEWNFVDYTRSGGGSDGDYKASHFTQRYSILENLKGVLSGGRLGAYDLALGAQWTAFDSDFDGQKLSRDAFKVLYKGRVVLAPGALPFRLDAYSYDMTSMSFDTLDMRKGLLSPGIAMDINNGQTIITGVQFMAGIRNGSYLGKYREVLSKWPRIFVDYRDYYRRDLHALDPVEVRDSNLAFVSLNKKDNWFHYRMRTYKDYFNPEENESTKSFMLGTIDHRLTRHWINMTNWIKLSVDGVYSVSEKSWNRDKTERFGVNVFTRMSRNGFSLNSWMNLQRTRKSDDTLTKNFELPVFANQRIDPQTDLRTNFRVWKRSEENSVWTGVRAEEAYYGKALLKTNQRSRVEFDSSLEAETASSYLGDGQAVRGKVEARTNPRMRPKTSWYSMASLATFRDREEGVDQTSLWEGELSGGGQHRIGQRMSVGGSQYLLYGSGSHAESSLTYFMSAASEQGFGLTGSVDSRYLKGSFIHSISELFFEHTSVNRIRNRLEAKFEYQQGDVKSRYNFKLSHRLDYQTRIWRLRLDNIYFKGEDTSVSERSFRLVRDNISTQWYYRQMASVRYSPNIYWESRLSDELHWGEDNNGRQIGAFSLRQEVKRTFYTPAGLRRKHGDIRQSLLYVQSLNGNTARAAIFGLEGNYYPTRNWRVGTGVEYRYYDNASNVIFYTLTAGMDFPKFKVDFNYRYGTYEDTSVVAHRYELNVRKSF